MTDMTKRWTPEEDAIIKAHYRAMGPTRMEDAKLLDRTSKAIRDRARKIGAQTGVPVKPSPKVIDRKHGEGVGIVSSVWDLAKR